MDKLFDISDGLETALGELTKARSALSMAAFELDSNAPQQRMAGRLLPSIFSAKTCLTM